MFTLKDDEQNYSPHIGLILIHLSRSVLKKNQGVYLLCSGVKNMESDFGTLIFYEDTQKFIY